MSDIFAAAAGMGQAIAEGSVKYEGLVLCTFGWFIFAFDAALELKDPYQFLCRLCVMCLVLTPDSCEGRSSRFHAVANSCVS